MLNAVRPSVCPSITHMIRVKTLHNSHINRNARHTWDTKTFSIFVQYQVISWTDDTRQTHREKSTQYVKTRALGPLPIGESGLHTRSSDLDQDDLQNLMGLPCRTFKGISLTKTFVKIWSVFPNIWANLWQIPSLATLKNPLKIPRSRSSGGWLPKFNNQFFLVHGYICGKIFVKIRSVVFT